MSAGVPIGARRYTIGYTPVDHRGHRFFVPDYAAHRPACRKLLNGKFYEPATHRLMARLLAERDGDLVHAGTFFGDMLAPFAAKCRGRVYAFEPVLENYVLARLSLIHNRIGNALLFNAGLGEAFGVAYMDVGTDDLHRGGTAMVADKGQVTTLMPVDSLAIDRLAILQLDVEGFELPALRGAAETIARSRPVIMVEDNENACAPFLEGMDYHRAGAIPGLEIWCDPADVAPVQTAITETARPGDSR